jgi:hypothetical protein
LPAHATAEAEAPATALVVSPEYRPKYERQRNRKGHQHHQPK